MPLSANLLPLTPISAFRPRRWRGALLPHRARVRFEIQESAKRPVSAVADDFEVRDVVADRRPRDPRHEVAAQPAGRRDVLEAALLVEPAREIPDDLPVLGRQEQDVEFLVLAIAAGHGDQVARR